MATAFETMSSNTHFSHQNQCVDPEMDNWVDFNAMPSPTPMSSNAAGKQPMSRMSSAMSSPTNTAIPMDSPEDHQTPIKPSHEYERFRQQTGLPTGSLTGLHAMSQAQNGNQMFSSYGTGLDDFDFSGYDGMNVDEGNNGGLPAFFFPAGEDTKAATFVDPSAISQDQPQQNMRVYPGMHQQQAALAARAQQQAMQQRQQQMLQQNHQRQRAPSTNSTAGPSGSRRTASHQPLDARTEETIARVVNQIRQNSAFSSDDGMTPGASNMPSVIRSKKDEDDMDEDERLLASEEGKKLSSKERRQLRNKVSARAFRSRRKEYIGQLEGEVNAKNDECLELKAQNDRLMQENASSRAFIEKLLRHPAFHPFIDELSRDYALSETKVNTQAPQPQQQQPEDFNNFQQQQRLEVPQQQQHTTVGMTMIPETPLDMSSLSLSNGQQQWPMNNMNYGYQPQVFAVLELPGGPTNPIDTAALAGKTDAYLPELPSEQDSKTEHPVVEVPAVEEKQEVTEPIFTAEEEADFSLYVNKSTKPTKSAQPSEEVVEPIFGDIPAEKALAHYTLVIPSQASEEALQLNLDRMCAKANAICDRLQTLTSFL